MLDNLTPLLGSCWLANTSVPLSNSSAYNENVWPTLDPGPWLCRTHAEHVGDAGSCDLCVLTQCGHVSSCVMSLSTCVAFCKEKLRGGGPNPVLLVSCV